MKWYWVLLIIVGVILVIYAVARFTGISNDTNPLSVIKHLIDYNINADVPVTDQISCRPGTCECTRTDGSKWCSSACCKKSATAFIPPSGFRQVGYSPNIATPGLP